MINAVTLVGRLTKDPEIRYAQSGTAVTNVTMAVNRNFKTQDGQDADFINIVVFKRAAESLAEYQKKGNLIGVTGRIQSRSFENKEGKRIFVTEVVADSVQFLEPKKGNNQKKAPVPKSEGDQVDMPDDLPF